MSMGFTKDYDSRQFAKVSRASQFTNLGKILPRKFIIEIHCSFARLVHPKGPNGVHQCLVFELLGPSVSKVLRDYHEFHDQLEADIIIRISKQLLQCVSFIHGAGMGHRDISCRNISFTCKNLSNATEEDMFKALGHPEIDQLVRLDGNPLDEGLPKELIKAAEWEEWIDEDEEDVRVLDFGESFLRGEELEKLAQPGSLKAPETIFADSFDYRVDLWRTGYAMYSLVFGANPFQYLGEDEVLVVQMIGFVGHLPKEWQSRWDHMKSESSHDLELEEEDGPLSTLERRFDKTDYDPALRPLEKIIKGLMRFLPSNRITASMALDLLSSYQRGIETS